MSYRINIGNYGERYAEQLLLKKGYKIIAKNFRSKFGEIDLIAEDNGDLVFVEVKTRFNNKYGKPEEAVTPIKLRHITKTAQYYIQLNKNVSKKQRIEVVALEIKNRELISAKIIEVV